MTRHTPAYAGASVEAIERHYSLSDAFFALWLDPSMTYTCALWDGPEDTLETAQTRKLDYLIEQGRANEAGSVLDVGCGWGSLLNRLVQHHGVQRAVGLTLSDSQAKYIQRDGDARLSARLENWADHEPDDPYDAIISIGALEHFASMSIGREARVEAYRRFFSCCHEWLVPRGRVCVQTNIKGSNTRMSRETVRDLVFISDRIFPDSEIPWLSEVVEATERLFDVVLIAQHGEHYARTAAAWHANLLAHKDEAIALVGETTVADYLRYLGSTVTHFENRHLGLARIVLERI